MNKNEIILEQITISIEFHRIFNSKSELEKFRKKLENKIKKNKRNAKIFLTYKQK